MFGSYKRETMIIKCELKYTELMDEMEKYNKIE